MRIYFVRHGMTAGNSEKRYIGRTDENLSAEGREELGKINYPDCDTVFCSPMKRCLQTAEIIYPDKKTIVCNDLRECDFGDFEGRNYSELNGNEEYRKWVDSGGKIGFPNGESPDDFRKRCCDGFIRAIENIGNNQTAAFVVHGGTIMSILDKFAFPHKDYFEWHTENGHGYICEYDDKNKMIGVIGEI